MTREELLALIDRAADEGWKELDLSGKGLTELPAEIGKLVQLETLILGKWEREKEGAQGIKGYELVENQLMPLVSGNELKWLPPELAKLDNLQRLDISGNLFAELPDVVTQLCNLEQLTLIRAQLKELPDKIGQFNQNANIANFVNEARDNAQITASNFNQTSGTNTAELLQLIAAMRQTAAQFPKDIQNDIVVDIDDVEEEIKKPDNQRNLARLRKRLIALATIGTMIATPIAGVTDFANNAIDLGSKLGIELQLPPAP